MIHIDVSKKLHTAEGSMDARFQLSFDKGEFLTLFGSSGAGKTTLLRLIAGLETPENGTITVMGDTWFDSDKHINLPPQKRNVGFVFQDYALFPTMTVRENLLYAAESKEEKLFVDTIIDTIELSQLSNRYPHSLSGGQKQRVALARALTRKPDLLLLDEPLSALDPSMRSKLQDELSMLHKKLGVTTLLVSHDIAETVKLSNRVAEVDFGRIKRISTPIEFFNPQSLSGKLQLIGEVLAIKNDYPAVIVTLLVSSSVVRTVMTSEEAANLKIGKHAIISTKAFNPIVLPCLD